MRIFTLLFVVFWGGNSLALPTQIEGKDLVTDTVISTSIAKAKKGTVVLFLSARCPCSSSHENHLQDLAKRFSDFQFIGVHSNTDEPESEAVQHFKNKFSFPIIQDNGAKLADSFKALKTPHVFVLGPKGELLFAGGASDSHVAPEAKKHFLEDALKDIEAGQKPRLAEARTLGCAISR